MTEKNRILAEKWVRSFIVSKGFLEPQAEWLTINLTDSEKQVTSIELISDTDAIPILTEAYRRVKKHHHFTDFPDELVHKEIRDQINLARSQMLHGYPGRIHD